MCPLLHTSHISHVRFHLFVMLTTTGIQIGGARFRFNLSYLRSLWQWASSLQFSGMWCHVVYHIGTNVSEESAASIFRIKQLYGVTSKKTVIFIVPALRTHVLILVIEEDSQLMLFCVKYSFFFTDGPASFTALPSVICFPSSPELTIAAGIPTG